MKNDFEILSVKEEQKLSDTEIEIYYEKLRKYILKRKLTNTTLGACVIGPKLKKITHKIAIFVTKKDVNFTKSHLRYPCCTIVDCDITLSNIQN